MLPALLLVDLQQDYLNRPGLEPGAEQFVPNVARLLDVCRRSVIPIFHAVTWISSDGSNRMPHWIVAERWACVEGTPGAQSPDRIAPLPGEAVFSKPFFNAFDNPELAAMLAASDIDTLIVAGIYTHACVRATVLDAYRRGYKVWVAADAVASAEPVHACLTLDYLDGRAARCMSATEIIARLTKPAKTDSANHTKRTWLHHNPSNWEEVLTEVPLGQPRDIEQAVLKVHGAQNNWERTDITERAEKLSRWLECLLRSKDRLVALLVLEVGKPVMNALAEFDYAIALLKHTLNELSGNDAASEAVNFDVRYCPVGTVGLITPWNNPLAIPVGKIGPALAYGNTAVWKPALQAPQLSMLVMECLAEAGLDNAVALVTGNADTGRCLLGQKQISAVSFTGSIEAGRRVSAVCAVEGKKLQAELGGNNAAIIMADADLEQVVRMLVPAIFGFAGQRCTAIRRVIVEEPVMDRFEAALVAATMALNVGDPENENVQVGPLISREQQSRMAKLSSSGGRVLCGGRIPEGYAHGCWFEPTLIVNASPDLPLVAEEGFGPIAVIMASHDIDHALALNNSVRHGLVTAVFSPDARIQRRVIEDARSGVVVINQFPLAIDPTAPFGGWKASGIGLPEHGRWDKAFYTRTKAVYGASR